MQSGWRRISKASVDVSDVSGIVLHSHRIGLNIYAGVLRWWRDAVRYCLRLVVNEDTPQGMLVRPFPRQDRCAVVAFEDVE